MTSGTVLRTTLLVLLFSPGAQAQSGPFLQLAQFSASDGGPSDYFGTSIAVSGGTVVVGANNFDGGLGEAYVFVQPASGWGNMTQTAKLTASDGVSGGDGFGYSVAISGNTIVVGAPGHRARNGGRGAVYVFVEPSTGWQDMTETAELSASDEGSDDFGQSVAISGNTLVVGSPANNNFLGAAYVFLKPAKGWSTTGHFQAKLTDTNDPAGELGIAVATTGDTVVAGAYDDNNVPGAAYIFVRPAEGWTTATQTAELTASDGTNSDLFGLAVAISGNTVLVGARNNPYNGVTAGPGAAYLFVKPASGWVDAVETAKLTASNAVSGAGFGFSVALDVDTAVVGAAFSGVGGNADQGVTYVFNKPPSGWRTTSHFSSELTAIAGTAESYCGSSTSISGTTVAVGGYAANAFEGSAYLFGK